MPGVGDVQLLTPSDYSMRIWVDPQRLADFGMTPADIINALQAQNIQAAIGRIGAQPALPDQRFQLTIQTQGRLTSVEEFGNVVVRANPGGSFVRVRDVARVELAARLSEQQGRQDGKPGRGDRHLPGAGRQCHRQRRSRARLARRSEDSSSRRAWTTRSPTTPPCSSTKASTR